MLRSAACLKDILLPHLYWLMKSNVRQLTISSQYYAIFVNLCRLKWIIQADYDFRQLTISWHIIQFSLICNCVQVILDHFMKAVILDTWQYHNTSLQLFCMTCELKLYFGYFPVGSAFWHFDNIVTHFKEVAYICYRHLWPAG